MKPIQSASDFCIKYKAIKQLGEGGYGAVYMCQNKITKALYAMKLFSGRRVLNKTWCPERKEHLPNELVLWEDLDHPNIMKLIDVYRDADKDEWSLIMEYDAGYHDLFDYVDANQNMSSKEAAGIIKQLVKAVYYLTLKNVDHRDIKDENLLYNPTTKQLKLIDFGSSGQLSSTPYFLFRGTDVYIPPEYFLNGSYRSFPASVWAIGCIAYVLLAGDCPFNDRKEVKEFTTVEKLNPKLSGPLTLRLKFIKDCLNPDPDTRILLSDLHRHAWLQERSHRLIVQDANE